MKLYRLTIFLLGCLSAITSYSQKKSAECKSLHEGIFYNYPKNTDSKLLFERFGKYQKETNLKTGDTTVWEIKWKNDCVGSLEYINGNNAENGEFAATLKQKKAKVLFKINTITNDYYTYTIYLNSVSNLPMGTDTMWMSEKINLTNNKVIEPVTKEKDLRKPRFNDTSYALLYIYRPGKFTNSLANYPVYLDNNVIGIMKNKSGYIYKILEEGTYELGSKLMDNTSSTRLEVKKGQKYYIKSMIHWGIHTTRNFNLEMRVMPEETGEKEFDQVIWNK